MILTYTLLDNKSILRSNSNNEGQGEKESFKENRH